MLKILAGYHIERVGLPKEHLELSAYKEWLYSKHLICKKNYDMKILEARRGYANYEKFIPDFNNLVRGALLDVLRCSWGGLVLVPWSSGR